MYIVSIINGLEDYSYNVETIGEALQICFDNNNKDCVVVYEGCFTLFRFDRGSLVYRKARKDFIPTERFLLITFTPSRSGVQNTCFTNLIPVVKEIKNTPVPKVLFMIVDIFDNGIVAMFENGKCIYSITD